MTFDVAGSRSLTAFALAVTVCLPAMPTSAQPAATTGPRAVQDPGASRPRMTAVQGTAWAADNTPIPNALLRLRNVITGKIVATTVADADGRFTFAGIPEGTYLVELVSERGRVLAVGHVFTVSPGETVATFVRLGAKVRWVSGFFGTAALAVVAGAATAGVVALAPEHVPSVSPNR
jgi:hypothetical protein